MSRGNAPTSLHPGGSLHRPTIKTNRHPVPSPCRPRRCGIPCRMGRTFSLSARPRRAYGPHGKSSKAANLPPLTGGRAWVSLGQVFPPCSGAQNHEDALQSPPVVLPGPAPRRLALGQWGPIKAQVSWDQNGSRMTRRSLNSRNLCRTIDETAFSRSWSDGSRGMLRCRETRGRGR
jgi:hypothetical protein